MCICYALMLQLRYGVVLCNSYGRGWDNTNAGIVYQSLQTIEDRIGYRNMSFTRGVKAVLVANDVSGWTYSGITFPGNQIVFYTDRTIPMQNALHEWGHVYNNAHHIIENEDVPTPQVISAQVEDKYWGMVDALQHPSDDESERFADYFANYMIINLTNPAFGDVLFRQPVRVWEGC